MPGGSGGRGRGPRAGPARRTGGAWGRGRGHRGLWKGQEPLLGVSRALAVTPDPRLLQKELQGWNWDRGLELHKLWNCRKLSKTVLWIICTSVMVEGSRTCRVSEHAAAATHLSPRLGLTIFSSDRHRERRPWLERHGHYHRIGSWKHKKSCPRGNLFLGQPPPVHPATCRP